MMRLSNMEQFGASKNDWLHFDIALGLTSDLLPVVSNPNVAISKNSTLKNVGKTPSIYNREGDVVGLTGWTGRVTTSEQINKWSNVSDYGICIQTRNVRAIDVDVSDPELAKRIHEYITHITGATFPCRIRANSSRFLLMFFMPGDFNKQIIALGDNNIIEFLANGQQFIAVGTHPSGERYDWVGGLPYDIPSLSVEAFTTLWASLATKFNGNIVNRSVNKNRDTSKNEGMKSDDITDFLDSHWNVHGIGDAGERYIECPFADSHTSESNETATAYFPAGTGGFDQGHFRCLHAHCIDRDDGDFLNAIGYNAQFFEILPPLAHDIPLPAFKTR